MSKTMTTQPLDPEELGVSGERARAEISARTTVGAVRLSVMDRRRSVSFYREALGLEVLSEDGAEVTLGAGGRALLVLVEDAGSPSVAASTGLYHFALLLPQRADLARWVAHAAREHVPLTGLCDHFVSEAIYLDDPDGHGVEIYWDRPRELWEGQVAQRVTTFALDVQGLLSELADPRNEPFDALPAGTVMGHVHLRVSSIPGTVTFYRDVLGLAVMAQFGSQIVLLSAGGYHHHIAANTWHSAGASPPPPEAQRCSGRRSCSPGVPSARKSWRAWASTGTRGARAHTATSSRTLPVSTSFWHSRATREQSSPNSLSVRLQSKFVSESVTEGDLV